MRITIGSISFDDSEGALDYTADVSIPQVEGEGGEDYGRFMIRLAVDGDPTQVYAELGQTGDLAGIEAALVALQRLHVHLIDLLGDDARVGRCLSPGDWGRCTRDHGHDGGHKMPTEADWGSLNAVATRSAAAAASRNAFELGRDYERGLSATSEADQ